MGDLVCSRKHCGHIVCVQEHERIKAWKQNKSEKKLTTHIM